MSYEIPTVDNSKKENISAKENIWKFTFPESSYINPPFKVHGDMTEAKSSFYEFSKNRVRLMDRQELENYISRCFRDKTVIKMMCRKNGIGIVKAKRGNDQSEKFVTNLEILINRGGFHIDGENFEDIIPFVIEHEIFESWTRVKKGFNDVNDWDQLPDEERTAKHKMGHRLALRREFLLAERLDKSDRLFKWHMAINPRDEELYIQSWESAKKKLHQNEK